MFKATIYIETETGQIEKLSKSFDSKSERDAWLIDVLMRQNFSYLMVNGEPISVQSP